jgi:hypothetical protein
MLIAASRRASIRCSAHTVYTLDAKSYHVVSGSRSILNPSEKCSRRFSIEVETTNATEIPINSPMIDAITLGQQFSFEHHPKKSPTTPATRTPTPAKLDKPNDHWRRNP